MSGNIEDTNDNVGEMIIRFMTEVEKADDRSLVIVGLAMIELLLERGLTRGLLPPAESKDELFNGDRGVATLSAKIDLGHRLGLFNANIRNLLHGMRRIRNEFAHKVHVSTLDVQPFNQKVESLVARVGQGFEVTHKARKVDDSASQKFRSLLYIAGPLLLYASDYSVPLSRLFADHKELKTVRKRPSNNQLSDQ